MVQIRAEGLKKRYVIRRKAGRFRREKVVKEALKGISFQLEEGELVGYIGPNGAGKSTTVKILSGILTPDEGTCEVLGLTPWRSRVKHVTSIGVVFGQRSQLWWDLPVIDSFLLLRDIYRLKEEQFRRTMDELVGRLSLAELLHTPVRQLSLGQRMKCELAASLLHEPRILFLDEPTIGLDAVTKLTVRDFILDVNKNRGVTVVLTTHDMDDVESLCRRVMLIGDGQILLDGNISRLRAGHDERILRCELLADAAQVNLDAPVKELQAERNRLVVRFDPEVCPAARLIAELNERYGLSDVTVENTPIEQVVARVYREMGRGEVRV